MIDFLVELGTWIWRGFQAVKDIVVAGLVIAVHALRAFGLAIWDVAKFTWNDILKPIGEWLDRVYQRIKAFYDKVIAPVVDWLQRLSKTLRKIYNTFFKPILDTIENVRRVLGLLSSLGIEWAGALDKALLKLELKLSKPIQDAIKWVNILQSRIEGYVLTFDNLFHRGTLLASIARDMGPLLNMQWNTMLGTLTEKQRAGPTGSADLQPIDDHLQTLDELLAGGDATVGLDLEGSEKLFADWLEAGLNDQVAA